MATHRFRSHRVPQTLLTRARELRHESAPAEQILWSCLHDRQLNGHKFRRQHAVGNYVADFFCASCRLVVELDGDSHADRARYDERRSDQLNRLGLRVIRFVNTDVFDNLQSVLEAILAECEKGPSPQPSPLRTGEREDAQ